MDSPASVSERWTGVDYYEECVNVKRSRCNTALYPSHGRGVGVTAVYRRRHKHDVPDTAGDRPQRFFVGLFPPNTKTMRLGNA